VNVRLAAPLGFALAYAATWFVALHTAIGLHDDAALYRHVSGSALSPVRAAGKLALETIDVGSLVAGTVVIIVFAVARGRIARGVTAGIVVVCSVATAEVMKHGLPHVAGLVPAGRPPTFPSGHTSIAASLGLALVLVLPRVLRPVGTVVGAAYAAGIGLALVVLGWHYPSDVVGSFCIAGFWASVAAGAPGSPREPGLAGVALAAAAVAGGLLIAAVVAERHPAAVHELRSARALAATAFAIGLVSLGTFVVVTPLAEER
jgi:membrane-associated phospholipid phosphatase